MLISHTANDILTTQIGLYSDNTSIFIANSFGLFSPSEGNAVFPSSFFYWTDEVSDIQPSFDSDANFALTLSNGNNVPAPWVPFTRAGCTLGAFSTANIVLESTPFDVIKVFGGNSQQAMEPAGGALKLNQTDDSEGAAIHCALGDLICASNPNAVAEFQKILDHRGLLWNCATVRWLISASLAPTLCKATLPKPAPPIRISSRCGMPPTRIFPF